MTTQGERGGTMMAAELARTLAALPGFRWLPGMRDDAGRRVSWEHAGTGLRGGICDGDHRMRPDNSAQHHEAVPDLGDPATAGVLLAMLHATVGCDVVGHTGHDGPGRKVRLIINGQWEPDVCASLGEAVARSLVAIGRVGPRP